MSFTTIACIFLFAFWLAIYAKQVISLITDLIFAPAFKMRVKTISLFGLTFFLEEDDKWKVSFLKPAPLIQHDVRRDTRKNIEGANARNCLFLQITGLAVLTIATAAVCFLFRHIFFKNSKSIPEYLAFAFACGMIFQTLLRLTNLLLTHLVFMKRMGGYIDSLLDRIRAGETFSQLDLKPIEQLGFKKITFVERALYYPIYMSFLAEIGDTAAMYHPSHERMEYRRDKEFGVYEALEYYWLIYYFSAVEPDKANADLLMQKLGNVLYDDKLPNGRRVLAYYVFEHEHDIIRAEKLVTEGFAALDAGNLSNAERILERALLTQLNTRIIKAKFNTDTRL